VWITGLPASGKSTITRELHARLAQRGIVAAVLESDALRPILTPNATYTEAERASFYLRLAEMGWMLVRQGICVIFDATANRRVYREHARRHIPRFAEVYVQCPIEVCMGRDPKGIYKRASEGALRTVPGLQSEYEPPLTPDLILDCEKDRPDEAAERILAVLEGKGFLKS
jgi:adenylylsulfate kinase